MNRERLTILRDHLASLPDRQFDITDYVQEKDCGTVACVAGWANILFKSRDQQSVTAARKRLDLTADQSSKLFYPRGFMDGVQSRTDAIAAIQSMLDSPDDDALPVWPETGQ